MHILFLEVFELGAEVFVTHGRMDIDTPLEQILHYSGATMKYGNLEGRLSGNVLQFAASAGIHRLGHWRSE